MTIYFTIFLQAVCQIISFARLATFLGLVTDIVKKNCGKFIIYTLVFFTNKIDCHNITEAVLKVALNTITLTL
jgi:hypothetical protein